MEWAKFRTPEGLVTSLNNPFSYDCFDTLQEWLDCGIKVGSQLQEFSEAVSSLSGMRLTDIEILLKNPEMF
jgi:hypothetical protein